MALAAIFVFLLVCAVHVLESMLDLAKKVSATEALPLSLFFFPPDEFGADSPRRIRSPWKNRIDFRGELRGITGSAALRDFDCYVQVILS